MPTEIDNLEVKIRANAQNATGALNSLISSLGRVKAALKSVQGGVPISGQLSKSLAEMGKAVDGINSASIGKLRDLSKALNEYSNAVRSVKGLRGGVTQSVKDVQEALTVKVLDSKADFSGASDATGALNEFNKEIDKTRENLKKTNKHLEKTNDIFDKLWQSLKRIAFYRLIRTALKDIGDAFETGLKNAYYYSKQTGDLSNLAKNLDSMKSATMQMTNQLGAFVGELTQFLAPAIEWLSKKITKIAEYLTQLFAALNGDDYWQRAKYVEVAWDDAADALKKYKHQLLGLDELNNLSKNNNSDKKTDYSTDFEDIELSDKFQKIKMRWGEIKKEIELQFESWEAPLTVAFALAAIGSILLFATSHWALGLGMIVSSGIYAKHIIDLHWDEIRSELEGVFESYPSLFAIGGAAAVAIGALLLFTQHYIPGIALIVAGTTLLTATIAFNWKKLRKTLKKKFKDWKELFTFGSVAAVAIGALLIFTQHYISGIALILGGTGLLTATIGFNWDELKSNIQDHYEEIMGLFELAAIGAVVVGALLLFTSHVASGIGLIAGGTGVLAATSDFSWGNLLKNLKAAWKGISDWLESTVKKGIITFLKWVEDTFDIDLGLNFGSEHAFEPVTTLKESISSNYGKPVSAKTIAAESDPISDIQELSEHFKYNVTPDKPLTTEDTVIQQIGNNIGNKFKDWGKATVNGLVDGVELVATKVYEGITTPIVDTYKDIKGFVLDTFNDMADSPAWTSIKEDLFAGTKAHGGVVTQGSLFYAGEQGPEFVSSIGSTSAVANTGQMTDAIYKAAYMGMSKALKENGGNGMSGFEPATTDDLFIAMKKKATNYKRVTGNPAFN